MINLFNVMNAVMYSLSMKHTYESEIKDSLETVQTIHLKMNLYF